MEKYIIDRFESSFAVLEKENGTTTNVEASLLGDAKEGDVVIFDGESYTIDKEETRLRRERIKDKMGKIFKRR